MDSTQNNKLSNMLMAFGLGLIAGGIISIFFYFINKNKVINSSSRDSSQDSSLSYPPPSYPPLPSLPSEAVNISGEKMGTAIIPTSAPLEPYIGKSYPPDNLDPSNVYRLVTDAGDNSVANYNFNRTYLKNQPYGNGQYDMAQSSSWTGNAPRTVWSIFNREGQGWLSGGGYNSSGSNIGLPTGSRVTNLDDESNIFGEWVQVTFPDAMDFNNIKITQTPVVGYPAIINIAIVANNDISLKNAGIWKEQSPLVPTTQPIGPTMSPTMSPFPPDPSPTVKASVSQVYNNSIWTFLAEFKNLDPTNNRKLSLPFKNDKKYSTYRLIVTKTDGQLSSATIDYVRFYKN
jgi:hypothetical protein